METTISNNTQLGASAKAERKIGVIAAACVSFSVGAILAIASIALWTTEALEGRHFRALEICFPIASFLLLISGAHFLDRIDARKAKEYK